MADRREITREEFIDAAVTVATVAAGTLWDRFHDKLALVARPGSDSVWLDMRAARKHVKFGETKFRALINEGTFPQGVDVGGKLMWDRRVTACASAQPVLLAEFKQAHRLGAFEFGSTLPSGVPFRFQAIRSLGGNGPFVGGSWTQSISQADVGQTFAAPSEIVDLLRDPIRTGIFGAAVGFATIYDGPLDYWINKAPGTFPPDTFTLYVPDYTDYWLTELTRTIDSFVLDWVQPGQIYVPGGGQTIRFYGELIPPLAGDFNKNGAVDAADYVTWRDRVENAAAMPNGTGQGSFAGRAVPGDYDDWRANYGRSGFPANDMSSSHTVPEPPTRWVFLLSMLLASKSKAYGVAKSVGN
jgi:hypothetical protein